MLKTFFLQFILCLVIIRNVAYTEIDFKTYMQQVEMFLRGTLDYPKIQGDTGPLVYPAGFLYIYSVIYYISDSGTNILNAQLFFALIQSITLSIISILYRGAMPSWTILLLFLSKRIQSIYTLRLFNDPIAMLFLYLSLFSLKRKRYNLSGLCLSVGLSIKMNILLFMPGYALVLVGEIGFLRSIIVGLIFGVTQIILGLPFLLSNYKGYLSKAFEFNRTFDYKWSVNWKFLDQDVFYSFWFSRGLLMMHVLTLLFFLYKWENGVWSTFRFSKSRKSRKFHEMQSIIFTSNFIGIIFSRTLHYQFYSWYFYTLPFLLWSVDLHNFTRIILLGIIEVCWNIYPSTSLSSGILFISHLFLLICLFRAPLVGTRTLEGKLKSI